MKKEIGLSILGMLVLVVVMTSGCTSSGNTTSSGAPAQALNVTNLTIVSQGYGMYDVKAVIIPSKDTSYLEMVAIAYDSSGAVIERSPLVWNTNDARAGQTYKVNGNLYISGNEKPAKVEILIFDSAFSGGSEDGNIYKEIVTV